MTWHRADRRLVCDAVLYDADNRRVACPSRVAAGTAVQARRLASARGWLVRGPLGDRCTEPGHQPNRSIPDWRSPRR